MLQRTKLLWRELRTWPPGQRFQHMYTAYADHDSEVVRTALLLLALGCFTISVAFLFAPGPAWVPFALSIVIMATQYPWIARSLDFAELALRHSARWMRVRRTETAQHSLTLRSPGAMK
jgi:hypothetical protein